MADVQHSSMQHSDVHEPKHISINGTGTSGQVITNSSSTSGESEYRKLTQADVSEVDTEIMMYELDSSTIQTSYYLMPYTGTVIAWSAIVDEALVTDSNVWEVQIEGVQVTGTPLTITAGGAAGDNSTETATAANSFVAGEVITVVGTTIGNTDATVDTRFIITVRRS